MDARIMLAMTLIELGVTTAEKLKAIWKAHGVDEAELDIIISEVDRRLARRA